MDIGFLSSILEDKDFYQVIDIGSEIGYKCVELASWPKEKAERKYAGVSHFDIDDLDDIEIERMLDYCKLKKVYISSLAYYPNVMVENIEKRKFSIAHLKKVITLSEKLKVNLVTTFVGKDQKKTVEENLILFREIWPAIINYAKDHNTKLAIENCPMLFDNNQWPGGQNMFNSPTIMRKLFEIIDSPYFGINFDPSHYVWQMMDYIKPLYQFKDKIFHVHFKDIRVDKDKLDQVGIMAYPLEYMSPKLPGLGDIDWSSFMAALYDIGYVGAACVEVEDRAFESSYTKVIESLVLSKRYLNNYYM